MPSETQICTFTVRKHQGIGSTFKAALKDLINQTQNLNHMCVDSRDLNGTDFRGCTLKDAQFVNCNFSNCNFQGCNLMETCFLCCDFNHTDFRGAKLLPTIKELIEIRYDTVLFGPPIDGNQLLLEF